jgi:hypothetical protein
MGAVTKKTVDDEAKLPVVSSDMFEADAGAGLENLGQSDYALPFLKVLSRQDPILDDLENAKPGDILNTVTNQVYKGKEGVVVIPCAYQRRYIEWAPRGQGNGAPVNIYTPDEPLPKTERSKEDNREYIVGGSGNYLDETHQHFVLVVEPNGTFSQALIAMKSTQLKKSRKWNSMIAGRTMMGKNGPFTPPRFSHRYLLKTLHEENSKGSWHGWEISVEGQVNDPATYLSAKNFANSILRGEVNVKHVDDTATRGDDDTPF